MIFLCLLYVKMDIDDKEVSEIISKEYNDSRQTKDIRNAICKIDQYNFCTK